MSCMPTLTKILWAQEGRWDFQVPAQRAPEVLEILTHSDWADDTETRKFVTCTIERLGGHLWDCSVAKQTAVALSSGDSEFYGIVRAAASGIQSRQLLQHCLVRRCFSTSCASVRRERESVHVQVPGKSGHLSKKVLWVQEALRNNHIFFPRAVDTHVAALGRSRLRRTVLTACYCVLVVVPSGTGEGPWRLRQLVLR